jgi:hypothetical protein
MRVTIVNMHSVWCTAEKAHPEEWKGGINTHIHVDVEFLRATGAD